MFKLVFAVVFVMGGFLFCSPTFAAEMGGLAFLGELDANSFAFKAVGAGIAVLGAGLGIGRIGGAACESMARQPEMAGQIQTAMIISAALIEGAVFAAILFTFFI